MTATPEWLLELSRWYDGAARDLPWRAPGTTPYAVLVSEVMLQQTPVIRVVPAWTAWVERWPTAAALAAEPSGEAVRMWGRLGYPRRALRLHAACCAVVAEHGGELPTTVAGLLALPGVGDYTARAVAAFALRQRHPVVDTNVRRVVARVVEGVADAAVTKRDLARVEALLPEADEAAAHASIALMELGALLCTARAPRCTACPVRDDCAWWAAGRPELAAPVRRPQAFAGTDRPTSSISTMAQPTEVIPWRRPVPALAPPCCTPDPTTPRPAVKWNASGAPFVRAASTSLAAR